MEVKLSTESVLEGMPRGGECGKISGQREQLEQSPLGGSISDIEKQQGGRRGRWSEHGEESSRR